MIRCEQNNALPGFSSVMYQYMVYYIPFIQWFSQNIHNDKRHKAIQIV